MLEQKLSTLQELVQNTQEASEGGWQVQTTLCFHNYLSIISLNDLQSLLHSQVGLYMNHLKTFLELHRSYITSNFY